ncbi:Kelch repeat-containing protein [Leptospira idonii]|uniref:Kelch repeat-containing protein n=1 Tax=Leptospira idonii TaxID=1193500 RepID=A0A4V3JY40_9LEPT|nr:kelch repeat-containing protein [Leptospira idonii]TGN19256.1 kelch repeat-containing protein [Leptospira idonii]
MNKRLGCFLFVFLLCNCFSRTEDSKEKLLFWSDVTFAFVQRTVNLSSDPDLQRPVSTLRFSIHFSEPIASQIRAEEIEIRSSSNKIVTGVSVERLDNVRLRIVFPDDTVPGEYSIDFSKCIISLGKQISPSEYKFIYDPEAPSLSSSHGNILDSSFFSDGYLDVNYSEPVQGADFLDHYTLSGSAIGSIRLSSVFKIKTNLYRLFFTGVPAASGGLLYLSAKNIKDEAGNNLSSQPIEWRIYGFKQAGNLLIGRRETTPVILNSGEILITGGYTDTGLTNTAEIYNPTTRVSRFTAGNLSQVRRRHSVTLLQNGKVFIAGGGAVVIGIADDPTASTEIYDPSTDSFTPGPSLQRPKMDHTATLLSSGKVLIAGGIENERSGSLDAVGTAEIYDPVSNSITSISSLNYLRKSHRAARLQDGNLYMFGGTSRLGLGALYAYETEIFNEATSDFSVVSKYKLNYPRSNFVLRTFSSDGIVAIGSSTSEVFDPKENSFQISSDLSTPRNSYTSVQLSDGKSILFGGENDNNFVSRIDFYDPASALFRLGSRLLYPRVSPFSVLLPGDKVLIFGGYDIRMITAVEEYSYEM